MSKFTFVIITICYAISHPFTLAVTFSILHVHYTEHKMSFILAEAQYVSISSVMKIPQKHGSDFRGVAVVRFPQERPGCVSPAGNSHKPLSVHFPPQTLAGSSPNL